MKIFIVTLTTFLLSMYARGQNPPLLDSLQKEYKKVKGFEDRTKLLESIAQLTMNTNPEQADKYGEEEILLAEKSRDMEALVKAYIANGIRCSAYASLQNYTAKAMGFFEKGKTIAQENNLEKYVTFILVLQSSLQVKISDVESASKYLDQATALSLNRNDDSTTAILAISRGKIQLARNEKIAALRSYLTALRLADKLKNVPLQRQGLQKLSDFYTNIDDYDKAIDYYIRATKKLDELPDQTTVGYAKVGDTKNIGDLYAAKKIYPLAISGK